MTREYLYKDLTEKIIGAAVENKSITEIAPIDEVQLVSYLKASKLQVGLIFNFGKKSLQFKRRVLTSKPSAESA